MRSSALFTDSVGLRQLQAALKDHLALADLRASEQPLYLSEKGVSVLCEDAQHPLGMN